MADVESSPQRSSGSVSAWNVPNVITAIRLLLVPVFAIVLFTDGGHTTSLRVAAAVIFLVAALTDRLDGELARRLHQVTDFGKIADPIADKALVGTALIGLSILGDMPWWVTIVILAREIGVTVLRFIVLRWSVIAASMGGKVKTVLQIAAITAFLLPLHGTDSVIEVCAWVLLYLAVAVTVVTGIDYLVRAIRVAKTARSVMSK